ncbi:Zinc finger, SWIM-type [Sesbania bispinosa]|nr:Zinc finger, SWIM-type [Sesbania bispinosa]
MLILINTRTLTSSKILINTDSDVLDMFKLNSKCTCIHVYASLLNCEDNGVGVGNSEVVVSESDDEWSVGGEYQQDDSLETDYDPSFIVEEERHDENNDELSDYEEKHDLITFEHFDEDKVPIYFDRGMNGKLFVYEPNGKVKLEIGLLFVDVDEFRAALRDFVIQEGFEIERIKNEKARVTARCAADGCCWRIHASPTLDGKTYKIKTYNHVHSCIRTSKNSNATSTWIANKLESKLKADPNMSYAIMKKRVVGQGLRNAVTETFTYAKHRYCCNHLLNNFKLNFRTLLLSTQFWVVAMAYNEFVFEKAMDKLKQMSCEAANWLLDPERPKSMWARHTIDPECKSDHVTNNVCESFNSWVGDDRKKTILPMLESITCRLMSRFQRRYEKGCGLENITTPKIRKVLHITMQDGRVCGVTYASDDEFQVKDGFTTFVVNLRTRACGCNYWRLSGLPCKHACACISYKRANVEMFCDNAYTAKIYCLAYKEIIHPMLELDTNNKGGYGQIDPPTLRRLPGRPRINRMRGVTEGPAGPHDARRSNTVRCSNCNEFGHNILGCQRDQTKKQKKLKIRRRNQMNDASQESASSLNGASSQVTHEFGSN